MMDTEAPMTTGPYPAESRTTTSPLVDVAAIAAANYRQGCAIEQGLPSLPFDATKVRWAAGTPVAMARDAAVSSKRAIQCMTVLPFFER